MFLSCAPFLGQGLGVDDVQYMQEERERRGSSLLLTDISFTPKLGGKEMEKVVQKKICKHCPTRFKVLGVLSPSLTPTLPIPPPPFPVIIVQMESISHDLIVTNFFEKVYINRLYHW